VAKGGLLILSGILQERALEVRAKFASLELELEASPSQGEWVALVFRAS